MQGRRFAAAQSDHLGLVRFQHEKISEHDDRFDARRLYGTKGAVDLRGTPHQRHPRREAQRPRVLLSLVDGDPAVRIAEHSYG
jgi:hypothetical protein